MENERENLFDTPQEAAEDAVQDAYTQEVSAPAEEDVAAQSACAPEEAAAVCDECSTPVEHTAAQSSDEQKPKKKKQKRCIGLTAAVCLMVVCSILGGIIGGIVYGLVRDAQNKPHTSPVYDGSRPPTVIDPREVDTSKLMTPAEVYAANVNATVGISTSIVSTNFWGYQSTASAAGSGFVYSEDGYIITNYHVIQSASTIQVSFYDGTSLPAMIVGVDESNDLAVLKVEAKNLPTVIIGDSSNLNVGDTVVAIGNPLGWLSFSLTSGVISALEREITFSDGLTMNLIQTDCTINSGNSGGALFNMYGEVIGITNAKTSGSSSSGVTIDNIGYAIPFNHVREIIDSIIEKGYIAKPYIGVTIVSVTEEMQSYGLPQGASIQSTEPGSPAEKAGLLRYDIVTQINDEQIEDHTQLKKIVSESAPGDVLRLVIWRNGQVIELELTVGEAIQQTAG
ncbi:MAG: trypsin-like peptidase domain-containing protein [Oscillospiraceae bacterium]|nr:trypsin-like peptidase domain-containing protein [Oscillospiraceae bacterium]